MLLRARQDGIVQNYLTSGTSHGAMLAYGVTPLPQKLVHVAVLYNNQWTLKS